MKKALMYVIGVILAVLTVGCGILTKDAREWQPVKPRDTAYVHTVKWQGETLQVIAAWYTGNKENWQALSDANPVINPDRLSIGNQIFIPQELLKSREPLPREFIARLYEKPKKVKRETKKPAPQPAVDIDEEFVLFGPK
ncbi:MAG: LysM peptidoglycan-binding domain-containing protein [bacterium]